MVYVTLSKTNQRKKMKYSVLSTIILFVMTVQIEAEELKMTDPIVITQCDADGDGKISTGRDYRAGKVSKEIGKKEFSCYLNFSLKKSEESLKKSEEKGRKLDEETRKLDEDIEKLKKLKKILLQH